MTAKSASSLELPFNHRERKTNQSLISNVIEQHYAWQRFTHLKERLAPIYPISILPWWSVGQMITASISTNQIREMNMTVKHGNLLLIHQCHSSFFLPTAPPFIIHSTFCSSQHSHHHHYYHSISSSINCFSLKFT